jgi:hypothetical protein
MNVVLHHHKGHGWYLCGRYFVNGKRRRPKPGHPGTLLSSTVASQAKQFHARVGCSVSLTSPPRCGEVKSVLFPCFLFRLKSRFPGGAIHRNAGDRREAGMVPRHHF